MSTVAGLDTATDDLSVALVRDSEVVFERLVEKPASGRPRHAEALQAELEAGAAAGGGWERVDVLAVGIGPGSFTGLRVGIATARAIAQALGKAVVPVGTLAALARGIGESGASAGSRFRLGVLDARRGQVFAGLYDEAGVERWEPFVAAPEELGIRLANLGASSLAAGSGALRFRRELEAAGAVVLAEDHPAHHVWARHVCRLAAGGAPRPPEAIQPLYLRPPDAQVWLERDSA